VLVVDDFTTNLELVKAMMKPYCLQIDCVKSGRQAIDAIRCEEVRYNAVFMDLMMPEMDGVEATRIIREEIGTEYARNIPIIALTANAGAGIEEKLFNKGFQALLPKPIKKDSLDAILREWVGDREMESGEWGVESGEPKDKDCVSTFSSQLSPLNLKIDGIDIKAGLERFGGDGESYMEIMRSFAYNTRPLLESMRKLSSGETPDGHLADYAITVHAIKGSSRGIGAALLGDMAEALENAAKAGDLSFVKDNNTAFIDEAEKLINNLDDFLPRPASQSQKPKKDRPDRKVLSELLAACENYHIANAEAAMAEMEKCDYETEGDLVLWLRDNVKQMNFLQIMEKLVIALYSQKQ